MHLDLFLITLDVDINLCYSFCQVNSLDVLQKFMHSFSFKSNASYVRF